MMYHALFDMEDFHGLHPVKREDGYYLEFSGHTALDQRITKFTFKEFLEKWYEMRQKCRPNSSDTPEEKAAREKESWYYNLYCFLIDTGCRCGEAGAIQNSDISGKVIHVSKTVTRTAEGTYRIGDEAKTKAGTRDIPIRPLARQAIDSQREINRLLNNGITGINDTLFKSPRGYLLSDTVVNQDIARICKVAGIEKFTAHAFRDTFATRCVESGMQPKTLQEIMGHTDIAMTMNLYAHVMEETKVSQMQAVKIAIV